MAAAHSDHGLALRRRLRIDLVCDSAASLQQAVHGQVCNFKLQLAQESTFSLLASAGQSINQERKVSKTGH